MKCFKSDILTASENRVDFVQNGALIVDDCGKILFSGSSENLNTTYPEADLIDYKGSLIIPGLIDSHTHLPQFPAINKGKGELLHWLQNYIFPLESKFSDKVYAGKLSKQFFDELINAGTTTAVIFSTSGFESTDIIFESAAESGINAFIGMSLMDINSPSGLAKTPGKTKEDIIKLADKWHGFDNGRLKYIILPRYAGSCSPEMMEMASEISEEYGFLIQTHLSENPEEIDFVKNIFKENSYADIYHKYGLLTYKSSFAHCIYLSESELELLQDTGSSIIHCPASNRYLKSGMMPARKYLDRKTQIGLGTDIAAGYNISIFDEINEAIKTSIELSKISKNENLNLSPAEVFMMATQKNAEILKIDSIAGSLEKGKNADFLVLKNSYRKTDNVDDLLKMIISDKDREIEAVYIRGKGIKRSNE